MRKIQISIVVPVYNVEELLERCIDSLINQTLEDIEIILVDDGSTDDSSTICDIYAKRDSRVSVIHKKNGGLSDARNTGLLNSNGHYILFVDSDDYICTNTCEIFYLNALNKEVDVLVGDAIRIENGSEIYMRHSSISPEIIMSGPEFLKQELRSKKMYMAAWLNMYRKDFLIHNNLLFKTGILHEDEQWTPRVFLKAKRVKYVNEEFYRYIIRDNSITKKKEKTQNGIDLVNTCYELEKIYKQVNDNELKKLLNDYLVMLFLNGIHIGNLYEKKYNDIYNKKFLIGKPKFLNNRLKAALFSINKNIYKKINILFS